jgi:hypothetical protein
MQHKFNIERMDAGIHCIKPDQTMGRKDNK